MKGIFHFRTLSSKCMKSSAQELLAKKKKKKKTAGPNGKQKRNFPGKRLVEPCTDTHLLSKACRILFIPCHSMCDYFICMLSIYGLIGYSTVFGRAVKNEHLSLGVLVTAFGSAYLATRGGNSSSPPRPQTIQQAKESVPVTASSS